MAFPSVSLSSASQKGGLGEVISPTASLCPFRTCSQEMIEPGGMIELEMLEPGGMIEHEMIEPCVCACVCVKEQDDRAQKDYRA